MHLCYDIFFQNKIYIKSYILIRKFCYFPCFNIQLGEICVVSGKSEDNITLRTQFPSRICYDLEKKLIESIFLASVIKSVTAKMCIFWSFYLWSRKNYLVWRKSEGKNMYKILTRFEKKYFLLASVTRDIGRAWHSPYIKRLHGILCHQANGAW